MRRPLLAVAALLVAVGRGPAEPLPTVDELVRRLESGTPVERVVAAEMLGQIGPAAAEAAPALARVMADTAPADRPPASPAGDPNERVAFFRFHAARDALARIGPKSVPVLAGLLENESAAVREAAAEALGWLGADADTAVPALTKLLADDRPALRTQAAEALRRIGPKAESAVPALVALAAAPQAKGPPTFSPGGRGGPKEAATQALLAVGPQGRKALAEKVLPGLVEEYKTATPVPWSGPGLNVLIALGPDAAPAIPAIQGYIRRRQSGSDLDPVAPALLMLGPAGFRAFEELLADAKADRRSLLGSISTSRTYGNTAELTPLVPPLLRAMDDADPAVRRAAGLALAGMGERIPAAALDRLAAGLTDPHPDAAYALVKVGPKAVPVLTKALGSDDDAVRQRAAGALRTIGGAARSALPELRRLVAGGDVAASAAAARIGLDPKDAAVALRGLADADPKARLEALERAKALGPLAAAYQKELARLVRDPDTKVRDATVSLIVGLGGDVVPEAVGALATVLPPAERWAFTLTGFGRALGPAFRPAVPALVDALGGENTGARDTAVRLLSQIGPGAADAVPALIELLAEERDPRRAGMLLEALGSIGPAAKDAVPTVLSRSLPRADAAMCLGRIGPSAKAAAPAMRRVLADPDPAARLAAAYALARIEGDPAPYRGTFERALLPHPGGWRAGQAMIVFDRLAPDCPELIPAAAKWLRPLDLYFRGFVVTGIGKYGPAAKGVVPELVRLLDDESEPQPHRELAAVLRAFGPDARAAAPGLRKLLDHRDAWVAVAARDAIARIEEVKSAE